MSVVLYGESAQFSHSVMSDSLRPYELQDARPPCPSPTPGVYPNSCSSSRWRHPASSSSVIPFSSCPQSLPAPGSFPMSQLFTWGGQNIRVSASASVLPVNIQEWSPLRWTGYIHPNVQELPDLFSSNNLDSLNIVHDSWMRTCTGFQYKISASRLPSESQTFLKPHLLSQTAYAHHVAPFLLTPK